MLKLRGGLAGVDTNTVATAATCITGLNAVYCALAPEPAAEAYGVKGASFNVVQMIKALGNTNLMVVVLAACLLKGVDTNTKVHTLGDPYWVLRGMKGNEREIEGGWCSCRGRVCPT